MGRPLFLFLALCQSAVAAPIDVYLLAGQSNAVYKQNASLLPADLRQQGWIYRSWITGGVGTGEPAAGFDTYNAVGQGWSVEATLGATLADSLASNFALIHMAWGNTSLYYDWNVNGPPQENGLYAELVDFARDSLAQLVDQGYEPQVRAAFWVQGENDAFNFNPANAYQANLDAFIAELKTDLLHPFDLSEWEARYGSGEWDGDDFLAWQRSQPLEFYATLLHARLLPSLHCIGS